MRYTELKKASKVADQKTKLENLIGALHPVANDKNLVTSISVQVSFSTNYSTMNNTSFKNYGFSEEELKETLQAALLAMVYKKMKETDKQLQDMGIEL